MSDNPPNNLAWRVTVLEREVDRLKELKPDVHAERLTRLTEDVRDLRRHMDEQFDEIRREVRNGDKTNSDELGAQRKILISAWVTIGTGLFMAYVLGGGGLPGS